jgi:hypothetical protein
VCGGIGHSGGGNASPEGCIEKSHEINAHIHLVNTANSTVPKVNLETINRLIVEDFGRVRPPGRFACAGEELAKRTGQHPRTPSPQHLRRQEHVRSRPLKVSTFVHSKTCEQSWWLRYSWLVPFLLGDRVAIRGESQSRLLDNGPLSRSRTI